MQSKVNVRAALLNCQEVIGTVTKKPRKSIFRGFKYELKGLFFDDNFYDIVTKNKNHKCN